LISPKTAAAGGGAQFLPREKSWYLTVIESILTYRWLIISSQRRGMAPKKLKTLEVQAAQIARLNELIKIQEDIPKVEAELKNK